MIIFIVIFFVCITSFSVWFYKKNTFKRQMSVRKNLEKVLSKIESSYLRYKKLNPQLVTRPPRLVAVSKTKPIELILEAYNTGQRNFGENYVQELYAKATNSTILQNCGDIRWHFIGHLQRKSAKLLCQVPNLWVCESIDCEKVADTLNAQCVKCGMDILRVMIQVNTSREENKFGCETSYCPTLVDYVVKNCPKLLFTGLMTIGRFGYDPRIMGVNPDFLELSSCRLVVCRDLCLAVGTVDLSMGMSSDYEHAIELGSNNVRVGTSIFGTRDVVKKEK